MINGLEGIPGSGKSYEAVAYHVLPALQSGRKVITNLPLVVEALAGIDPAYLPLIEVRTAPAPRRGEWDASNIAKEPAFRLWMNRQPEPAPEGVSVFGWVWDYWSDWQDDEGRGPLYVIDECHVPLPVQGTPDQVVQWFKLHRHFNADVLLMTQSFRDSNQPIARLIANLIKCRKADMLGQADHYIRKVHAGYRGAVIQTDKRPYKPQYFSLYKSHTQGRSVAEAKAQDVTPMLVQFNRIKWLIVAAGVGLTVWAWWPKDGRNAAGLRTTPVDLSKTVQAAPTGPVVRVSASASAPAEAVPSPAPQPRLVEPFDGKQLHIVGVMAAPDRQLTIFTVSANGQRIFDLTSDETEAAGYTWRQVAYCFGWLEYEGKRRPITCDAPVYVQGSDSKPIVIDSGTGRRSDDAGPPARVGLPPERVQQPMHYGAHDLARDYRGDQVASHHFVR